MHWAQKALKQFGQQLAKQRIAQSEHMLKLVTDTAASYRDALRVVAHPVHVFGHPVGRGVGQVLQHRAQVLAQAQRQALGADHRLGAQHNGARAAGDLHRRHRPRHARAEQRRAGSAVPRRSPVA